MGPEPARRTEPYQGRVGSRVLRARDLSLANPKTTVRLYVRSDTEHWVDPIYYVRLGDEPVSTISNQRVVQLCAWLGGERIA